MATMDYNSGMNGARREGEEKGREAATVEIARNAIAKGLTPELVEESEGRE